MRRLASAIAVLAAAACSRQGAPSTPPPPPAATAPAPSSPQSPSALPGEAYVTAATALRREPTDAPRVAGGGPKRPVPNYLTTLLRGEKVTILESTGDWAKVKASDESIGWLKASSLLAAVGVGEATLLVQADAFDRPDLLAVNAKRKIEPGTLVLVVRGRELFSEVNTSGGGSAWVLTDRLSTVPRNVNAAKLVEKARWLARSGKSDEAKAVLELARKEFSDVPFVDTLARELGEAPDAGATDGGAIAPGPPTPPEPGQRAPR